MRNCGLDPAYWNMTAWTIAPAVAATMKQRRPTGLAATHEGYPSWKIRGSWHEISLNWTRVTFRTIADPAS